MVEPRFDRKLLPRPVRQIPEPNDYVAAIGQEALKETAFTATLRGVYHARIDYPKPTVGEKSTIATALGAPPTLPAPMDGNAPPVAR